MKRIHSVRANPKSWVPALLAFAAVAGAAGFAQELQRERAARRAEDYARLDEAAERAQAVEERMERQLAAIGARLEALRYAEISRDAAPSAHAPGLHAWGWWDEAGRARAEADYPGSHAPDPALRARVFAEHVGRLRALPAARARWLAPANSGSDGSAAGGNARYLVYARRALLDPRHWLVALIDAQSLLPPPEEAGLRAFLIDAGGTVLAHSQPSYIGSLLGARLPSVAADATTGRAIYAAADRLRVAGAWRGLKDFAGRIVVERVLSPPAPSLWAAVRRHADPGLGLAAVAALLALTTAGLAFARRRRRGPEGDEGLPVIFTADAVAAVALRPAPDDGMVRLPDGRIDLSASFAGRLRPVIRPARRAPALELTAPAWRAAAQSAAPAAAQSAAPAVPASVDSSLDTALATFGAARSARSELESFRRVEREIVTGFLNDTEGPRDPRELARRLSEASSRLCSSPVLFFAFHEGVGSALLTADSGFASGEAPVGLSFPLQPDAVRRILAVAADGSPVSLSEYEPLAHLLLKRLGVAHFEAWSITSRRAVAANGTTRLIGVLVVLQAGVDSVLRRDALRELIQVTGTRYEGVVPGR
jgi:hypothetical protein